MSLDRRQLVAVFRLLVGIGILLMMLAFLRACLSPPPLPPPPVPGSGNPENDSLNHGSLPPRY